jgi:hypothetical protein
MLACGADPKVKKELKVRYSTMGIRAFSTFLDGDRIIITVE